ncbi:MAG: hypothetical protein BGO69_11000 [Bacteroidetes bacterium 46-16]|nr:MAG: hypothetical protein BGO69_11000 [Bacteroidetes bacterium 46-16]
MPAKPDQKLKYFLYARKSSESEDRQVQSIEDQVNRLTELARSLGLEVTEILTEAKSAKKPYNRPVFTDMLRRIGKGEADGILCWQINRLSRNPIDSGTISWMLQQGTLKSIQAIDKQYLPDDNVLLFNVESGMANQYIIDLRKNCRRGMEGRAERGWYPAQAPLGYVNDKANHRIIPDRKYFPLIRRMWDMMLTGKYNPEQIRRIANEQWGFRTPKHKQFGNMELTTGMIYKLFGNVFYTGMFEWSGKRYPGKHKPMISLAEYDHVQVLLGRKGKPRLQRHTFAYTGLMRCAECGCMYTATEKVKLVKSTQEYKTYTYYHCSRKHKKAACTNAPLTASDLESQFETELERYTIAPEFLHWALDCIAAEKEKLAEGAASARSMQEQSLSETEKELGNLTRMRYKELIDDEAFIRERDMLASSIARLKVQLREQENHAEKWLALTEQAFVFAAYAQQEFAHGPAESRRDIVSCFGSNYAVKDKKLLYEASVWLIPIEKAYPGLLAEYRRLELQKDLGKEVWNERLGSIIQRWCAIVEDVRTEIKKLNNPTLHIPILKVI